MPDTLVHARNVCGFHDSTALCIFNLRKYRLLSTYMPVNWDLNVVLRLSLEKQLYLYFVNLALGLCHFWEALEHKTTCTWFEREMRAHTVSCTPNDACVIEKDSARIVRLSKISRNGEIRNPLKNHLWFSSSLSQLDIYSSVVLSREGTQ